MLVKKWEKRRAVAAEGERRGAEGESSAKISAD